MPQYTVSRSGGHNVTGSPVAYRDSKKAIAETNKTALTLAKYVTKSSSGMLTLTNAKGKTVATWKLEPDSVNIYGEWRLGYGAQK